MVFRITAAGDTQIRPLTREDMPNELDLLGDRRPMRAGANGQRPMRVLLVDDHEISRAAVSALLRTEGADVASTGTDDTAIAVAIGFRPAVAIVDVTPADATGFRIADLLRALPDGPAVVLTSSVSRHRFASRLGNYRFVAKADLSPARSWARRPGAVATDPVAALYVPHVLARAVMEAGSQAWWLLGPGIGARRRVIRSISVRASSARYLGQGSPEARSSWNPRRLR
jgi:CheY-like chemotaxis protein